MAKREFTGDAIDMTELQGESHLSEVVDDSVVDGSSDDNNHSKQTNAWPSGLDRSEFTDLQAEIIVRLCLNPTASNMAISEMTEGSDTSVYNVKHKLSAMNMGDAVPFDVPDEPTRSVKAAQPYMDEEPPQTKDKGLDKEAKLAKVKGLYNNGMGSAKIAKKVGLEEKSVRGKLGALTASGEIKDESSDDESTPETNKTADDGLPADETTTKQSEILTLQIDSKAMVDLLENTDVSRGVKEELLVSLN